MPRLGVNFWFDVPSLPLETADIALYASTRPAESGCPVYLSVLAVTAHLSWFGVRPGTRCSSKAISPVTTGAAIEVPLKRICWPSAEIRSGYCWAMVDDLDASV